MIVFSSFHFSGKGIRDEIKSTQKYFVLGFVVTLASLIVHLAWTYDVPYLSTHEASRYVNAFVQNWDSHRIPIPLSNIGLELNLAALAIGISWLIKLRKNRESSAYFLIFALGTAALLGLAFALLSWLPPERLPLFLLIMMPDEFWN